MKLSVIDENENDYFLPGKPLTPVELFQLIENSRNNGSVDMENAHTAIRNRFDAD